jgi:hypothetical protein
MDAQEIYAKIETISSLSCQHSYRNARSFMSFAKTLAIAVATSALLLAPAVADAKGQRGGKGVKSAKWSKPQGWSRGNKIGWRGGTTPPGWRKGRKNGWSGNGMPPGLLKRR